MSWVEANGAEQASSRADSSGYFDNSGWVVNMGGGSVGGLGALPWYVWAGAAILALAWIKKRGGR